VAKRHYGRWEIGLAFDSKEDFIRCLELVSRYPGITCEVLPWKLIKAPPPVKALCEQEGIKAREVPMVPLDEVPKERVERASRRLIESAMKLDRAARTAGTTAT